MPLTQIQNEIAEAIAENRSEDSYLAGGAALHLDPRGLRYSQDLDYFHDTESAVASAFAKDFKGLEARGFELKLQLQQPGYIRCLAKKEGTATKIEWAHDSAWRFLPTMKSPKYGFLLHPLDLATNKLLALAGRDEARDYLDIHFAHEKILDLGSLCWAAVGKDPGFTPLSLLEQLKRRGKYRQENFNALNLIQKVDIQELKSNWLEMLSEAEILIARLPMKKQGCLFFDAKKGDFVSAQKALDSKKELLAHFASNQGVVPKVSYL